MPRFPPVKSAMHQPDPAVQSQKRLRDCLLIAAAGAASLSVAVGIGRFAFTPLLPMMLHDGVVDLDTGSHLATANYLGYLVGAMLCTALPRSSAGATIVRLSLLATALLTAGMAYPLPALWTSLRFTAGVISAIAFVFTSDWCVRELASRGAANLGSLIFTGPGVGITLSGLAASGMVAAGWHASSGWLAFATLAAVIIALIWPVLRTSDMARIASAPVPRTTLVGASHQAAPNQPAAEAPSHGTWEMVVFTIAYGLAGFGYIVTATFLPVIARDALPGSAWLDLFWPILGISVVVGCVIGTRAPPGIDYRAALITAYLTQALGVALTLVWPSVAGFVISSVLVGLPFTAISFLAVQDVRRLRPHHVARFVGLLTAVYGIGQIAGPPLVGVLIDAAGTARQGFALALAVAALALVLGAVLFALMIRLWPLPKKAAATRR